MTTVTAAYTKNLTVPPIKRVEPGNRLLIANLGEDYVSRMYATYAGRVPADADLVCYRAAAIETSPRNTANTIRTLSSTDFGGGWPIRSPSGQHQTTTCLRNPDTGRLP